MLQFKIKLFSNFMKVLLTLLLFINFAFALNLQKPSNYKDSIDISNWYMSEKLDGIRAYWDGKELFTKNRNKIFAPSWFTKDFPPFPLDGELWTKRGDFENIQKSADVIYEAGYTLMNSIKFTEVDWTLVVKKVKPEPKEVEEIKETKEEKNDA